MKKINITKLWLSSDNRLNKPSVPGLCSVPHYCWCSVQPQHKASAPYDRPWRHLAASLCRDHCPGPSSFSFCGNIAEWNIYNEVSRIDLPLSVLGYLSKILWLKFTYIDTMGGAPEPEDAKSDCVMVTCPWYMMGVQCPTFIPGRATGWGWQSMLWFSISWGWRQFCFPRTQTGADEGGDVGGG